MGLIVRTRLLSIPIRVIAVAALLLVGVAASAVAARAADCADGVIETVAGSGRCCYSGDGGPATEATLHEPYDVALGADGSLYIADNENRCVRKVDPRGIITTVAGDGEARYAGDGGPATEASLHRPSGVAVEADGTLYIADEGNGRIRKVDSHGIITTIAGSGEVGHPGDGGPATEASLYRPCSVALGADGSVYLADSNDHRIRKVDPDGTITTVAGDGWKDDHGRGRYTGDGGPATEASLWRPRGVIVAPDGTLYVADSNNQRVRKVDALGTITTVAGNGQRPYSGDGVRATATTLYEPMDVALGRDGSLYISDTDNHRVRKVDPNGIITTVAGNGNPRYSGDGGPATEAGLMYPHNVVVAADGSLYIAASVRIRKVDPAGIITTVAGNGEMGYSGDDGPATEASLNLSWRVARGSDGSLYIADINSNRIRKVDPNGIITTVAGNGEEGYRGDGGLATEASLRGPRGVTLGPDGTLYISDTRNHRIRKVDPAGIITTAAGNGEPGYSGDGGPATEAKLDHPVDVAVGADGSLYIAGWFSRRIRKVEPAGIITTIAGTGAWGFWGDGGSPKHASIYGPTGLALAADGTLYIADRENHRIRRIRWRPCDPDAANAAADDLRTKAGESRDTWREVFELYLIAEAWNEALAAAERVLALTAETDERERMRADVLVARVHSAKRDDHEARRRLIRVLARAHDPVVMGDAAAALVDLYLLREEVDQAIATLNDLRMRAQDRNLRNWIDGRLAQIAGE